MFFGKPYFGNSYFAKPYFGIAPTTVAQGNSYTSTVDMTGTGNVSGSKKLLYIGQIEIVGQGSLTGAKKIVYSGAGSLSGNCAVGISKRIIYNAQTNPSASLSVGVVDKMRFFTSLALTGIGTLSVSIPSALLVSGVVLTGKLTTASAGLLTYRGLTTPAGNLSSSTNCRRLLYPSASLSGGLTSSVFDKVVFTTSVDLSGQLIVTATITSTINVNEILELVRYAFGGTFNLILRAPDGFAKSLSALVEDVDEDMNII